KARKSETAARAKRRIQPELSRSVVGEVNRLLEARWIAASGVGSDAFDEIEPVLIEEEAYRGVRPVFPGNTQLTPIDRIDASWDVERDLARLLEEIHRVVEHAFLLHLGLGKVCDRHLVEIRILLQRVEVRR